jgi:hypothetical protein
VAFAGVADAQPGQHGVEIFFFLVEQIIRLSDQMAQVAVKGLLRCGWWANTTFTSS